MVIEMRAVVGDDEARRLVREQFSVYANRAGRRGL